ncbi:TlpA disulfide reductase family protein [Salegentibacter salegens]|uniref:Peroxiredoxin n=1 Tax=Salegentibacter salegens TaxID=143223 RepID=A0A1M7KFK8_9FLAO|nr:TlpA disulfide reductase family protein [Salegentibacter salegens]PRX49632.1 peroxiredoxin [Salegentibacter salegens]SHM64052.1 Peroxiredoxin [Salegentibacter salegens]
MRLLFVIFSFLFIVTSLQAQESSFSLTGKTNDIKDGSWLYFQDLVNGGTLDSAEVQNNSFKFDTKLPEPSMWVMLHTKDRSKFKELWLQDKPMRFDASNTDFQDAEVTGSISQELVDEIKAVYEDYDKISETELRKRQEEFIKSNPNALISLRMLYEVSGKWGQETTSQYFEMFPEEIKKSSFGKRILSYLNNDNIPQIGEKYADFELTNQHGKNQKFSALTGNVTLLQFWASTCEPSKMQNRELKKLYRKYKSDGLEIVAVSRDLHKEDWVNSIEKDKLKWVHLSSLKGWEGPVFTNYGIRKTPSNFLINTEGSVVGRNLRGDELEENIKELLK